MEYINILELIVSLTSRFSAVPYNFYDHIFILKIQQQLKAEYDKAVPEKWHIKQAVRTSGTLWAWEVRRATWRMFTKLGPNSQIDLDGCGGGCGRDLRVM